MPKPASAIERERQERLVVRHVRPLADHDVAVAVQIDGHLALSHPPTGIAQSERFQSIGGGVVEMRIDYGPGYRVYYTRRGATVVMLLCAGDKRTQTKDIKRAINMVRGMAEKT